MEEVKERWGRRADWLAMHSGEGGTFPDGVTLPESSQQVRELLQYAADHDLDVIPYGGGTSTGLSKLKSVIGVTLVGLLDRLQVADVFCVS